MEESSPIELLCDNQAAISTFKNSVDHDQEEHVEVDCHFISDKIGNGIIDLSYILTQLQLADILTKTLFRPKFEDLCSKLSIINLHDPTSGGV